MYHRWLPDILFPRRKNNRTDDCGMLNIIETAKTNSLKVYEYVEYMLTKMPKHGDDTDRAFLDNLLLWSSNLLEHCQKSNKYE